MVVPSHTNLATVKTRPRHFQKIIVDEPVDASSLLILVLIILASLGEEGHQLVDIEPNIIINLNIQKLEMFVLILNITFNYV